METATFGGGCFWCTEALFKELRGVISVTPGYAGGTVPNPTYEQVCGGNTGHAEVIQVEFNPTELSYRDLLYVFFKTHDPTTLNQQGADMGTQYRSVIFYHDGEQKRVAESLKEELGRDNIFQSPLVTEIVPFSVFYPAEDYHKSYYDNNRAAPYCLLVVDPKIDKFRKDFGAMLKS
jgi:peptide-methionine (S)-S-oxide reductase